MKAKLFIGAIAMTMMACTATAQQPAYDVTFKNKNVKNGSVVYIIDYDTRAKLDSAIVEKGTAHFTGTVEEPRLVRFISSGVRLPLFILEEGTITVDNNTASGTYLNESLEGFNWRVADLEKEYGKAKTDEARQAVLDRYESLKKAYLEANIENPIGFYIVVDELMTMDKAQFDHLIEVSPDLLRYEHVKMMNEALARKEATAAGKMFTDFEVEYNGETHRLSDYVGKGNYTLVDFWASWCGPCIRETAVIKDLYKEYGPKGLDVVGVAVWDEPDNTLEAIEKHKLPWKQIINAQTIPTDLYGILGIPCIILFAPDGTIVSRDLQGDALRAAVAAAFAPAE